MFVVLISALIVMVVTPGLAAASRASPRNIPTANVLSTPLTLFAWDEPNCRGNKAYTEFNWTSFNHTSFDSNMSTFLVSRSFRLNRTLEEQEQLDISVTNDNSTWYPDKDLGSHNSSSCTSFLQSYYAINGSPACHNTPPFTCYRLWNNPGLVTD